ncbi:MAG: hypothetical protein PHC61_19285 [Chitinivibrionales bacterium]|nr:hypothetical protein [Chitinivibrionales bacterium]
MKKSSGLLMASFLVVGFFLSSSAFAKAITVSGVVQDSLAGTPISQATILLYASDSLNIDMNNLQFDSTHTGADGTFSHPMTVSQNAIFLFYGVLKQGYPVKYSLAGILLPTVNLNTIKLNKITPLVQDTLTVSGSVVDSATGSGIGGVVIIMSGLGSFDTTGNSAVTGNNGAFQKRVIIGNAPSNQMLNYLIAKDGYKPAVGQTQVPGKQVDLGSIVLRKNAASAIKRGAALLPQAKEATTMSIYTISGKLLYSGAIGKVDKVTQGRSSPVIVDFKFNNVSVGEKMVPNK